jgi:hypothetical protein
MTTRIFVTTNKAAADETAASWQQLGGYKVTGIGPVDKVEVIDPGTGDIEWSRSNDDPNYVVIVTG